jgi:CheY-like chemotaxis protein
MLGNLTLILADDDPDDFELIKEALQETAPSHTLHWVKHGDVVVEEVKKIFPDILFLDLNMPGCDGMECLKLIKEDPSLETVPVVIYTTSNASAQVKECYRLGAARYLLKPVSYTGIFKGLELIIDQYQTQNLIQPEFDQFLIDTYKITDK